MMSGDGPSACNPRVDGPKLEGRAGRRHAPRELLPCLLPTDRPENDAWGGLEVSRSVRSRASRRGQRVMMINDAVSSLNSLYGNNVQPSGTSTAQTACVDRLRGAWTLWDRRPRTLPPKPLLLRFADHAEATMRSLAKACHSSWRSCRSRLALIVLPMVETCWSGQ